MLAWRPAILLRRDSNPGVFLWILRNFWEHLFWRIFANGCFCLFLYLYSRTSLQQALLFSTSSPAHLFTKKGSGKRGHTFKNLFWGRVCIILTHFRLIFPFLTHFAAILLRSLKERKENANKLWGCTKSKITCKQKSVSLKFKSSILIPAENCKHSSAE